MVTSLRVGDSKPQNGDQDREYDDPQGINPPAQLAAANRHEDQVVSIENLHLRELVPCAVPSNNYRETTLKADDRDN